MLMGLFLDVKKKFLKNHCKLLFSRILIFFYSLKSGLTNVLIAGLLPFTSIYLELNYIVDSVWGHKVYHLYGVLFTAVILLIIVVICVSITLTYF